MTGTPSIVSTLDANASSSAQSVGSDGRDVGMSSRTREGTWPSPRVSWRYSWNSGRRVHSRGAWLVAAATTSDVVGFSPSRTVRSWSCRPRITVPRVTMFSLKAATASRCRRRPEYFVS